MPEILSLGGDREPGPWPRRVAVIAVLLLVALVIIKHLPRHRQPAARPGRTAVALRPRPLASGAQPPVAGLAAGPDGVSGPTLPWAHGLRLPVTGEQPAMLWPATGRTMPIGGLPRDRSGYRFTRMTGGWAVQADSAGQLGCGSCARPRLPVYFLADGAQSVLPVGAADEMAPGAAARAMWLTSYPPGADMSTAAGTAQQVSATGKPLGTQLRLPAGYLIYQATVRGLLLAPVATRPGTGGYELWNPSALQPGRTFDRVIAASARAIAWATPCAPLCRVRVLDLETGRQTVVRLPAASSAANAAFSPGGGLLALQLSFSSGGGELAMQLSVASVASGRLAVVPGTWVSSDALVAFGWPAASNVLVAELSFTTKVQVVSWYPGATRPALAVIRPGQDSASLVVGYHAQ